jgi:hypothetical protein
MNANVQIIELVRGKNGRLWPADLPRPPEELLRLRKLEHALCCRDGLAMRAAQALMLSDYAVRRSLGAICNDLRLYECPRCAGRGAEPLRGAHG